MIWIQSKLALRLALILAFGSISLQPGWPQSDSREEAARYAETGQRALAAGRYPEAQQNFEQLAKLDPKIAEVHATLAAIYFKLREYELSVHEVRTAQKLK